MKGRPPKPVEVKRREGNPGKRALGDPIVVGERILRDEDEPDVLDVIEVVEGEVVEAGPPALPAWMPAVPSIIALSDALALEAPQWILDAGDREVPGFGTVLDVYDLTIGQYAGARLWRDTCTLLVDSRILAEGDLFAVEQFVAAALEGRRAFLELRARGAVRKSANVARAEAGVEVRAVEFRNWKDANAILYKWAEQLGLSPLARTRLGLGMVQGRKLLAELDSKLPGNPLDRRGPSEPDPAGIDVGGRE